MASRDYYFQILVVNRQGYINELEDIFSQHLDVHEINPQTQGNYLHVALENASQQTPPVETIQFYIDRGLDVNLQDHLGNTPLHYAVVRGNIDCALLLLEQGANCNVLNQEHVSALGLLDEINQSDKRAQLLQKMLEKDGDALLARGQSNVLNYYISKSQTDHSFDAIVDTIEKHLSINKTTLPTTTPIQTNAPTEIIEPSNQLEPVQTTDITNLKEIGKHVHLLIHENILVSSEVVQNVMQHFGIDAAQLPDIQNLVREAKQEFMQEQKSWPGMTDCDKLLLAFYAAFKQDIITLPAAGDNIDTAKTQVAAFQKDYQGQRAFQGYCFFTSEDIYQAIETSELSIHFGHVDARVNDMVGNRVGKIVFDKLKEQGLEAKWDGQFDTPIVLTQFVWRNRTDFNLFKSKYLK